MSRRRGGYVEMKESADELDALQRTSSRKIMNLRGKKLDKSELDERVVQGATFKLASSPEIYRQTSLSSQRMECHNAPTPRAGNRKGFAPRIEFEAKKIAGSPQEANLEKKESRFETQNGIDAVGHVHNFSTQSKRIIKPTLEKTPTKTIHSISDEGEIELYLLDGSCLQGFRAQRPPKTCSSELLKVIKPTVIGTEVSGQEEGERFMNAPSEKRKLETPVQLSSSIVQRADMENSARHFLAKGEAVAMDLTNDSSSIVWTRKTDDLQPYTPLRKNSPRSVLSFDDCSNPSQYSLTEKHHSDRIKMESCIDNNPRIYEHGEKAIPHGHFSTLKKSDHASMATSRFPNSLGRLTAAIRETVDTNVDHFFETLKSKEVVHRELANKSFESPGPSDVLERQYSLTRVTSMLAQKISEVVKRDVINVPSTADVLPQEEEDTITLGDASLIRNARLSDEKRSEVPPFASQLLRKMLITLMCDGGQSCADVDNQIVNCEGNVSDGNQFPKEIMVRHEVKPPSPSPPREINCEVDLQSVGDLTGHDFHEIESDVQSFDDYGVTPGEEHYYHTN